MNTIQPRNFFVMTRTGAFAPAAMTQNQCKVQGHPEYHYELRMVFGGNVKLDTDHFIVDHQQIDDLIARMRLLGSCEQMTTHIMDAVVRFMSTKDIPLMACKCVVRPTIPDGPAVLERIHIARTAPVEATRLLTAVA